jgi:hypothetical protein
MGKFLILWAMLAVLGTVGCTYETGDTGEGAMSDFSLNPWGGSGDAPAAGRLKTWGITGPLTTGNTTKAVTLQTGQMEQEGYAYVTVKFGVQAPVNGLGYAANATITFMVNGNPIRRVVSVGNGVEISGPADAVIVQVNDLTPASFDNPGQPYSVTIQVAPGTRSSSAQPLLNDVNGTYNILSGALEVIQIPANSGVIGVWVAAFSETAGVTDPNVAVSMQPSAISATQIFEFALTDPTPVYVPIAPGASTLIAANRDATHVASFSVLWVIDG